MFQILFILLSLFSSNEKNPVELGRIHWLRDYDYALEQSQRKNLPVFILFQEVPGCASCRNYGNDLLSHPFIVEIIEDHFIPLAIYNNKQGEDSKVLKKYGEPSWNNPVCRVVNSKGKDLVNRFAGDYSLYGLSKYLSKAMLETNRLIPEYFAQFIHEQELKNGLQEEVYFSMYCFWTGEKEIGKITGVSDTEAGFMHGKEVVKIRYNPEFIDLKSLYKQSNQKNCADAIFTTSTELLEIASNVSKGKSRKTGVYKKDKQNKYYIQNTIYQFIPMTSLQAIKLNSALADQQNPGDILSPRQLKLCSDIKNLPTNLRVNYIGKDFRESWWQMKEMLEMKKS